MSLVYPIGRQGSHCGYCNGKEHDDDGDDDDETFISDAMISHQLTVYDYQRLIDERWRRSGILLYRPVLEETCCQLQTIRLNVNRFELSRSQKKVLKRLLQHLDLSIQIESREQFLIETFELLKTSKRFSMTLETADATAEKYSIYCKYQTSIHGDDFKDLKMEGFKRFLCESPLTMMTSIEEGQEGDSPVANQSLQYGTFHQVYRLDSKIFAISVIDILPACISSVYLLYDPEMAFLSPGTLTALLEIAMIKTFDPRPFSLQYYYLGYYLRDCPKMEYKARFRPSELLDPKSLTWKDLSTTCFNRHDHD